MNKNLVSLPNQDAEELQAQIRILKSELDEVTNRIDSFESMLRAQLMDALIEEQELTILYKQQKKLKKEKRLEQKRRGKNYTAPTGLIVKPKSKPTQEGSEDKQERKRLYREAMMEVHPDRFSMQEFGSDEATELTIQLIEIYQSGDLLALQEFHAHIIKGSQPVARSQDSSISGDTYLLKEIQRLKEAITAAENKYTYQVLMTYSDPNSFLDELKLYYQDRIKKLRKRTRS